MAGRATFTTVLSRKAMPEPSTATASTQRPALLRKASSASVPARLGACVGWFATSDTMEHVRDPPQKGDTMGQPVVHFEVVGKDGDKLRSYYSELFGWQIDANNPMNYGMVQREGNTTPDGAGIGGGVGQGPAGYDGHVTFYIEVPDV